MERLLDDLAQRALSDSSWTKLLDAVCKDRSIPLADLLQAKNDGELRALKRRLSDPLLSVAIDEFKAGYRVTRQTERGLEMLTQYAASHIGAGARLGDLTSKSITAMCRAAENDPEADRKRNSIRRMMLRAISLLLRFHIGNVERDRIFAEVRFAAEDDTREVHLSPAEINRLISACYELGYDELATLTRLALQTSADRGVLLAGRSADKVCRGLLKRDVRCLVSRLSLGSGIFDPERSGECPKMPHAREGELAEGGLPQHGGAHVIRRRESARRRADLTSCSTFGPLLVTQASHGISRSGS